MTKVTFDRVNKLLSYAPETGLFHWKVPSSWRVSVGDIAGSTRKDGYIAIGIDNRDYQAHRLAHLLMTGHWPKGNPEHENQIKSDNRWENIKDVATRAENEGNKGLKGNNTSGLKGVSWFKQTNKWRAYIGVGKFIHLGFFTDSQLAGLTYDAAAKIVWGSRFSCLNFPSEDSDSIVLSGRVLRLLGVGYVS